MSNWEILPLSDVSEGNTCYIRKLPSDQKLYRKLSNLGIRIHQEIIILKGEKKNPYLLELDNMHIFLDWDIAKTIMVKVNT